MNFFALLTLFHIVSPTVDVTPLPILATTFILDSNKAAIPRAQNRWQVISPGLLQNRVISYNIGTSKLDTAFTYIQLDSANHPIKYTTMPNESPVRDGSEFTFSNNKVNQRLDYANGVKLYTSDYEYSGNDLTKVTTTDSAGFFDSTRYTYTDTRLTQIETKYRTMYSKSKYVYLGTDTIVSQAYNIRDSAESGVVLWILKNGLLVKQNNYEAGKLFGFTIYEYPIPTTIERRRHLPKLFGHKKSQEFNLVGRNLKNK